MNTPKKHSKHRRNREDRERELAAFFGTYAPGNNRHHCITCHGTGKCRTCQGDGCMRCDYVGLCPECIDDER